jgi:purine-binding chemotaxis protein CheW
MLVFAVGARLCACNLEAVREIVTSRPATRLPGAPEWVRGLINLRGTLVTVVDLTVRFGVARPGGKDAQGAGVPAGMIVVVTAGGKSFGIGVSEVRDVLTVADDAVEAIDTERSAGGAVRGLVYLGAARESSALLCDVEEIARQAFVL